MGLHLLFNEKAKSSLKSRCFYRTLNDPTRLINQPNQTNNRGSVFKPNHILSTKPNQTKPNQTKPNLTKTNQTKHN
jgi:hypothetical protein